MTEWPRGRLIALEGIDGCGKSTQAKLLAQQLGAVLTFEPGATPLGASLRHLMLESAEAQVSGRAEALMMAADRAQHVADVLDPALAAGLWVVTDRYSASTLAYQGAGRGMPADELACLVEFATEGLTPDLTVLVDVPVAVAASRRSGGDVDKLEGLGLEFQERVAAGFFHQAENNAASWLVVDGNRSVDEVAGEILAVVNARFNRV